jgi:hypothetical protein
MGREDQGVEKEPAMQAALRVTTTVHEGGRIEVIDPQLPSGEAVDVIVLLPEASSIPRRSILDVLAEAPGQTLFQTPADVEAYVQEERGAWGR